MSRPVLWLLALGAPLTLATGCQNGDDAPEDVDDDPNPPVGDDDDDDDFGGEDPPEDGLGWDTVASPCTDGASAVLATDADGNTWIGCGSETGLFVLRSGETDFVRVEGSGAVEVDALASAGARVYVAGRRDDRLVVLEIDLPADDPQVRSLLPPDDPQVTLTEAGHLAVEEGGEIRLVDPTGRILVYSDGETWSQTDDWTEGSVPPGGSVPQYELTDLFAFDDTTLGVGRSPDGLPTVFSNGQDPLSVWHLAATTFDRPTVRFDAVGQAGTATYVVGAEDERPLVIRCAEGPGCLGRGNWERLDLGGLAGEERPPEDRAAAGAVDGGFYRAAFDPRGRYGILLGDHGEGASATFALVTADGGQTWTRVRDPFPRLADAAVDVEGRFVVIGTAGFLATGRAEAPDDGGVVGPGDAL